MVAIISFKANPKENLNRFMTIFDDDSLGVLDDETNIFNSEKRPDWNDRRKDIFLENC